LEEYEHEIESKPVIQRGPGLNGLKIKRKKDYVQLCPSGTEPLGEEEWKRAASVGTEKRGEGEGFKLNNLLYWMIYVHAEGCKVFSSVSREKFGSTDAA